MAAAPAQPTCRVAAKVTTCRFAPVLEKRTTTRNAHGQTVRMSVVRTVTVATSASTVTTSTARTTTRVVGNKTSTSTVTRVVIKPVRKPTPKPAPTPTPRPVPKPAPSPAPERAPQPPVVDVAVVEARILALTNVERVKAGLARFVDDPRIAGVARDWSQTMARTGAYVHRPEWAWLDGFPGWSAAAENIHTCDAGHLASIGGSNEVLARYFVDGWMASPGHRANILNPALTRLGVGVARAGDGRFSATQNFVGLPE